MRLPRRHITALILIAIYLLIVLSPLAPLALHSPALAHALTGECAEDCRVCGCSPERSAARACCCWQKKLKKEEARKEHCCKKKGSHSKQQSITTCPCGSGKTIAFSGPVNDELLPYHFTALITNHHSPACGQNPPGRLADRHGDPPDPPPKLTTAS